MLKQFFIDIRVRLAALFTRREIHERASEEVQFHLSMIERRMIESGMPPEIAQAQARRQFGNPALIREQTADSWRYASVDTLVQDVLYGLRLFGRKPGFAAIIVLMLALGIGANTTIFSVVESVLLRPLPYKDSARLVSIWLRNVHETGTSKMFASLRDYRAFARAHSFEQTAVATWATGGRLLRGYGPAQDILAIPVSESFFALLGVEPALGRTFASGDVLGGCSVVISDRLWRGSLSADPAMVGKSIVLDDRSCTVVGVMPASFAFYPTAAQAWMLLTPDFAPPPDQIPLGIFARLRPGVTIAQAQAEVSALHTALNRSDGQERDLAPLVADLHGEFTFLAEARLRTTLWILLAAVVFVLLIVCLNVANLLLGQGFARQHELAVRAALGCGRVRLARQMLTEGLLLAAIGGAAGIAVALGAIGYLRAAPIEMPPGADLRMSWPVLVFTAAISLATALLFGALPAWRASRLDAIESLRTRRGSAQTTPHRVMKTLIAAEMALSLVLLAGAGLFMQSALRMGSEPLGFESRGLVTAGVKLPVQGYQDAGRRVRFYDRVLDALGDDAALSTGLPPYGLAQSATLHIPGVEPSESQSVGYRSISPRYFRVMGERLLRGREFNDHDHASSAPVVIVNEALARRYFPNTDPIGQRIALNDPSETNPWRTIVGVVADEKGAGGFDHIGWAAFPGAFKPLAQDSPRSALIVARDLRIDLRRLVAGIDGAAAAGEVETMDKRLGKMLAYPRFRAALLSAFAVFAVLLAAIGLYGMLGQFVVQRTPEIGIRMALGARPLDVLRFIARQAGAPLVAGLALGLAGAMALSRSLASVLYGVQAGDPRTFAVVSLVLIAVGAAAAFFPARRAARVDPMTAMRNE